MSLSHRLRVETLWDGTPLAPEDHVEVNLCLMERGLEVRIEAPFYGDAPPLAPIGSTWKLWEHEVVELFVCGADAHYTELEVGPHGHHLVLTLKGRRNIVNTVMPHELSVEPPEGGRWRAVLTLPFDTLPQRPWTLNAYAISGEGDARRYAAAYPVPGDTPDFHRLECFRPWGDSA